MSVDPTPAPVADPYADLPLRDLSAQVASLEAVKGVVSDYAKAARAELDRRLLEKAEDEGTKSILAKDEDGIALATFSVRESKDRFDVIDPDAFEAYVMQHHPTEIETITRVNPAFQEAFLKDLTGADDVAVTDEGEVVPGIRFRKGGELIGTGIRWSTTSGQETGKIAALARVNTAHWHELGVEGGH